VGFAASRLCFGTWAAAGRSVQLRMSKSRYYLVDNLQRFMLSVMEEQGQVKRGGAFGSGFHFGNRAPIFAVRIEAETCEPSYSSLTGKGFVDNVRLRSSDPFSTFSSPEAHRGSFLCRFW
jgi:hypothetical protein